MELPGIPHWSISIPSNCLLNCLAAQLGFNLQSLVEGWDCDCLFIVEFLLPEECLTYLGNG